MSQRKAVRLAVGFTAMALLAARPADAPMLAVLTLLSPHEQFRGRFGISVAGAGDLNQDGVADVIVGASTEDPATIQTDGGRAYLVSGADGRVLFELHSPNVTRFGRFGASVAGADDVDEDGVSDLLVGAPEDFGSGRAYVFSGRDQSLLFELVSPNEENLGVFGSAVARAGDVDQDGVGDVIVGAFGESPGGPPAGEEGRAYVFGGRDGGLLFELASPNEGNEFGTSVASAGDVNRDGFADVVVGAPREDLANRLWVGRAYVFSGVDGGVLLQLASPNPQFDARFGASVAGPGDVNQDGIPDLLVGARRDTGVGGGAPNHAGRAYVLSGSDGSLLLELVSPNEQSLGEFGGSVASPGDVDQDGIPDLLVGARREESGTSPDDAGRAYLFSGRDGSLLRQLTSPNEEAGGEFGISVGGAGDIDQDGLADLIVGAPFEGPGTSPDEAGRAYVFLSATSGALDLRSRAGTRPPWWTRPPSRRSQ